MTAPSIKEALERLLFTAKILQQNSVGCATNHYGHDCELNGVPGWLTDTQKDIDAATSALAALSPPAGERREAIARMIDDLLQADCDLEFADHSHRETAYKALKSARLALDTAIDNAIRSARDGGAEI